MDGVATSRPSTGSSITERALIAHPIGRLIVDSWPESAARPQVTEISVSVWRERGPEATSVPATSRYFADSWPGTSLWPGFVDISAVAYPVDCAA